MKIIQFLGYSGSGKTSAISALTTELVKRGNKVGTLKHIHHDELSIDRKGKDSWIHRKSGASAVIMITPKEFVLIKERASEGIKMNVDIEDAFQFFRNEGFDYVFIEGFYKFLKNKHQIKQILCVRNDSEIRELLELHKKPICILGIVSDTYQGKGSSQNIPHLNLRRDKAKLIEIIS